MSNGVGTVVALARVQEDVVTRRTLGLLVLPALLAGGTVPSQARNVVEIVLNGKYFSEPATVRFMVSVEPDKENRTLRIEAECDDLFRASEIALNGEDEKRLHTLMFKNLPAGNYTLRAQVLSAHEVRGTATDEVFVTGIGLK